MCYALETVAWAPGRGDDTWQRAAGAVVEAGRSVCSESLELPASLGSAPV